MEEIRKDFKRFDQKLRVGQNGKDGFFPHLENMRENARQLRADLQIKTFDDIIEKMQFEDIEDIIEQSAILNVKDAKEEDLVGAVVKDRNNILKSITSG